MEPLDNDNETNEHPNTSPFEGKSAWEIFERQGAGNRNNQPNNQQQGMFQQGMPQQGYYQQPLRNPYVLQMKKCKYCGQSIPSNMTVCPYCQKSQNSKAGLIIGIGIALLGLLVIGTARASRSRSKTEEPAREEIAESVIEEQPVLIEEPEAEEFEEQNTEDYGEISIEDLSAADFETGITYDQLARNPEMYDGELVTFSGVVLQVIEGMFDSVEIRLAVNGDYEDVIYGQYDSSIVTSRVLEGDQITIYGQSKGLTSYTSALGAKVTLPEIEIFIIDALSDAIAEYTSEVVSFEINQDYDESYWYNAIVEIENTGTESIYASGISFDLEDEEGGLLQSDSYVSTCPEVIAPGEKGYLYASYNSMEGITNVDNIQFVPQFNIKTTRTVPHQYEVEDVSIKDGSYGLTAVGRLLNDTDEELGYLYVNVIYYDAEGKVLGITGTSVTEVPAGGKGSFEISAFGLPEGLSTADVSDYKIIAMDYSYLD